jgi:hypothetical protein
VIDALNLKCCNHVETSKKGTLPAAMTGDRRITRERRTNRAGKGVAVVELSCMGGSGLKTKAGFYTRVMQDIQERRRQRKEDEATRH